MATDRRMEEYASECVRIAEMAADPIIRKKMLEMAGHWAAAAAGPKQQQHQAEEPDAQARSMSPT